jgi:hypothetical protein
MDPTEPVWSIFVMMLLLLAGVVYCIVYIMQYDDKHDDHIISASTIEPNGSVEHELGGGNPVPSDADVPVLVEEENRSELREEEGEDDSLPSQVGGTVDGSNDTPESEKLL